MDSNGLNFWMLSQPQDWPLAAPAAASADVSSLSASLGFADTQIVLETPLPARAGVRTGGFRSDGVSWVDATGLQLSVTRGAKAPPRRIIHRARWCGAR